MTLLELVVVLTIVGVAVVLVVPPLTGGLRPWRVQEAVRGVMTLMKFARNQAVARRMPLEVVLDRSRNVYWLDHADAPALSDPTLAADRGIRLYALPAGFGFGEVTVAGVRQGGERVGISFFPKGNSMGGAVEVLDDRGRAHRISVDSLTGHARVER